MRSMVNDGGSHLGGPVVQADHDEVVVVDQRQPGSAIARPLTADEEVDTPVVEDQIAVRDVAGRCVVARALRVELHPGVDGVTNAAAKPVAVSR